jgi:[ribosomal protein S5]-alanine N-acetyltransferase
MRAVIRFGFKEMALNRVEADVTPGNEASVRVLRKLGFVEEGLLRQRAYWKGRYHDLRFFSLLRNEFEND